MNKTTNQTQADILKDRLTSVQGGLFLLIDALDGRLPKEAVEDLRMARQMLLDAVSHEDIQGLVPE